MSDFLLIPGSERVTTPFEDWCDSVGVHPEVFGAWEEFCRLTAATSTPEPITA